LSWKIASSRGSCAASPVRCGLRRSLERSAPLDESRARAGDLIAARVAIHSRPLTPGCIGSLGVSGARLQLDAPRASPGYHPPLSGELRIANRRNISALGYRLVADSIEPAQIARSRVHRSVRAYQR